MTTTTSTRTTQVFRVYIKASPERVWEAITSKEFNAKYGYPGHTEYDLRPGGAWRALMPADMVEQYGVPEVGVDGEVTEVDPPNRLVLSYRFRFAEDQEAEGFREVTWDLHEEHGGVTRPRKVGGLGKAARLASACDLSASTGLPDRPGGSRLVAGLGGSLGS